MVAERLCGSTPMMTWPMSLALPRVDGVSTGGQRYFEPGSPSLEPLRAAVTGRRMPCVSHTDTPVDSRKRAIRRSPRPSLAGLRSYDQ